MNRKMTKSLGLYAASFVVSSLLADTAHAGWFDKKADTPAAQPAPPASGALSPSSSTSTPPAVTPPAPPPPPLPTGAPISTNFGEVKDGSLNWMIIGSPIMGVGSPAQCVASRNAAQPGAQEAAVSFIRLRGSVLPNMPAADKLQVVVTSTAVPQKSNLEFSVDDKKADLQGLSRGYMRNASFDIADIKAFETSVKKAKKAVLQLDDTKVEFQAAVLAELADKLDSCVADQEKKIAKLSDDAKKATVPAAKK